MAGVHEDFGEKIGGAKKDLWKDRGLYADDLEAMNEREAEKFVKKDNVWKKPDYAAMLEEGIPLGVVYFIKKARDGLNASPQYYRTDDTPEKRTARQKEYIKTVRELQTVLSDVRTVEDAVRAYDRFFVDNGYLEKVQGWGSGIHYRATKKGQDNPVITNKLSNTMLIRSAEYFERNFTQEAKKEQFCVSKEQKIPKGYAIHFNDGKQTYSKNGDWKPGTYYVTKGYSILRTNFGTKEAALKWVQELAKGRNKNGKIRFVPPQLAHVKRTGPDYRNGVEITGQHYLDTFGFRGGEFGNWMNQNDRQTSLMLDAQNIGSIYELQGFSELHYYLKVEHVFTPAEVEALLSFQDPLDVARWCWEENNHEHSFPICDLLKEIDAEQKFEHFTSEPSAQDKYTLLMKRLGQNYFAYRESLMSRDKESLIEKAAEITAMQEAYSYLTTKFEFRDEMLDDVLALENPLKYFADRWLMPVSDVFDVDMDIRENIAGIRDSQEYLCQREPAVSVLARLQNAAQEVRECPAAEKPVRDFGAR